MPQGLTISMLANCRRRLLPLILSKRLSRWYRVVEQGRQVIPNDARVRRVVSLGSLAIREEWRFNRKSLSIGSE
jgi:hypothetical protein